MSVTANATPTLRQSIARRFSLIIHAKASRTNMPTADCSWFIGTCCGGWDFGDGAALPAGL